MRRTAAAFLVGVLLGSATPGLSQGVTPDDSPLAAQTLNQRVRALERRVHGLCVILDNSLDAPPEPHLVWNTTCP